MNDIKPEYAPAFKLFADGGLAFADMFKSAVISAMDEPDKLGKTDLLALIDEARRAWLDSQMRSGEAVRSVTDDDTTLNPNPTT